jgi:hypothetical protein
MFCFSFLLILNSYGKHLLVNINVKLPLYKDLRIKTLVIIAIVTNIKISFTKDYYVPII